MKRLLTLVLCCLLLLTSCTSLLERDYLVTSDHVGDSPAQAEDSYRVETYSALMAALNSYLEEGMEAGTLRFPTTYAGNLTVDLEKAKRQLMEDEPLGCYALADLTYHTSRIISYYEVELSFAYREGIDPSSLAGLRRVSGAGSLEDLFAQALANFQTDFTILLTLSPVTESTIREVLLRAYDREPSMALGLPQLTLGLYPADGPRSVVTASLQYPGTSTQLLRTRERVLSTVRQLTAEIGSDPSRLMETLQSVCLFDPEAGSSIGGALLDGTADREGMARAYQLLCVEAGIPCALTREGGFYRVRVTLPDTGETVDVDPVDPNAVALLAPVPPEDMEGGGEE